VVGPPGTVAGRPAGGPALFDRAEKLGIRILPGSDPLPFPDHADRAGSYGFAIEGPFDSDRPAESLGMALRRVESRPVGYGLRQSLLPFVRNQLAMQWRKHSGRPA